MTTFRSPFLWWELKLVWVRSAYFCLEKVASNRFRPLLKGGSGGVLRVSGDLSEGRTKGRAFFKEGTVRVPVSRSP